jgi:SWI/SNF-related matrix-associated actin-dependent regulator of chromatin subfamily A3
MGLGKTVEVIALVVAAPFGRDPYAPDAARAELHAARGSACAAECTDAAAASSPLIQSRATLIVCPLAVLDQWESEFNRHVRAGNLRISKYHGNQRSKSAPELASADVVLSTYSTVESELRAHSGSTAATSVLQQIQWHRLVIDGTLNACAIFSIWQVITL